MLTSIIIPSFNHSNIILRSLETWTKQTLAATDYEVIVVDNNSTDNSASLIKSFIAGYPNFSYVLEPKSGATHARLAGARISKGDILVFADDDGLFNENCLHALLEVYKQNTEVAAVTGKIELLWDAAPPEWIKPYEFMLGKLDYGDKIIFGKDLYLNGGLFSIKRDVFFELNGFNPDLVGEHLVGDGDTGLVRKLHAAGHLIGYTPFACMKHLQFVDKHGTVKDMGRRFFNIGISDMYATFRANHFRFSGLIVKQMVVSWLFYCKKRLEFRLSAEKNRKHYFSLMQRKGELRFFWNLRRKDIRKEVYDFL